MAERKTWAEANHGGFFAVLNFLGDAPGLRGLACDVALRRVEENNRRREEWRRSSRRLFPTHPLNFSLRHASFSLRGVVVATAAAVVVGGAGGSDSIARVKSGTSN